MITQGVKTRLKKTGFNVDLLLQLGDPSTYELPTCGLQGWHSDHQLIKYNQPHPTGFQKPFTRW